MKRLALLCGLLVLFAGAAAAQGENPKVEVYGGYSLIHNSSNFAKTSVNFNGASGSVSYNPSKWLGLVGDFGGAHYSAPGNTSVNAITYLFGPKLAYREDKFTAFAQVLFGGARLSAAGASSNAFAMTLGGGLDYNLNKHVAIRPVQMEYLMTRFASMSQNSLRYGAGVVFRW
jgi:opacity protein-like surface antigen